MGEYLTRRLGGAVVQVAKAGVCDDWRYVRRSEVEKWAPFDAGESDCRTALAEPTLWRFPWLDEDGEAVDRMGKRDMFRTLTFPCKLDIDHDEKIVSVGPKDGGYNVNMWIPCPVAFKGKMSRGGATPIISIVGERYEDGKPRTIFSCGYCAKPFSVTADQLLAVKMALLEHGRNSPGWALAIAERLSAKVNDE
jgi:hypothetical protein